MAIPIEYRRAMSLSPISDLVADLKAGRMAVLVDEEDRENEGDLIFAADFVTAEKINFMATHGRGLICMPSPRRMPTPQPRADGGAEPLGPRHQLHRVDRGRAGVSTGISARIARTRSAWRRRPTPSRRTSCSRARVSADRAAGRRARPRRAHRSVLRPGGARGLTPAAVLCEIMNDRRHDGAAARPRSFARTHGLKIGTIADLIRTAAAPSGWSSASPSGRSRRRTARSGSSSTGTSSPTPRISRSSAARSRPTPKRWCACTSRCR
jgi:3,4-dihydroxy 2-butanone 4-phosphate synthase/GTP cyclohydrolase II